LLHFFEAAAEFCGIVFLSAFKARPSLFENHRLALATAMTKQHLDFRRSTIGSWRLLLEYLGKQTRKLLEGTDDDRLLCSEIFADESLSLPGILGNTELAAILAATNKMRNDWSGHGGVVGEEQAHLRNDTLLKEVQRLREVMADLWSKIDLVHMDHCIPQKGLIDHEVAVLVGSHNEFRRERRKLTSFLDKDHLYLLRKGATRPLMLIPLIQLQGSPRSAKNACYFFSRLEKDGVRFVSYHHIDQPEVTIQSEEAMETIQSFGQPKEAER
jgi:hypothetical protein